MQIWVYIFWASCCIVFYNYVGYAILIYILNRLKRTATRTTNAIIPDYPNVSFIVAAYNEEDCIEKKILNSLELDYPANKLEFIFVTDGSTDDTVDIVKRFQSVRLVHDEARDGKSAAINRAVLTASHDILIFSDANTILNKDAIRNITRHFADEQVGGVAGEKKVISLQNLGKVNEVGTGEGLYWKYESLLKTLDSEFYSVVGAAGELFSVRRNLFEPVSPNVILDDFLISMNVALKGYRIIYEPKAFAMELPSFSLADERKRKIRIAAGAFQAIVLLRKLFLIWKQPRLSFLYISHRLLRWTLSPLCLILCLMSSFLICYSTKSLLYSSVFLLQVIFYAMAAIASTKHIQNKQIKLFKLSYYFVFVNISVILGFFRFIRGRQPTAWEKVRRLKEI
ncbi:glycosyltransferase family 2 protein [Flavitalea antarctica]